MEEPVTETETETLPDAQVVTNQMMVMLTEVKQHADAVSQLAFEMTRLVETHRAGTFPVSPGAVPASTVLVQQTEQRPESKTDSDSGKGSSSDSSEERLESEVSRCPSKEDDVVTLAYGISCSSDEEGMRREATLSSIEQEGEACSDDESQKKDSISSTEKVEGLCMSEEDQDCRSPIEESDVPSEEESLPNEDRPPMLDEEGTKRNQTKETVKFGLIH
ncbi:uncharacterized protein LOC117521179 [Thalassophryne amazonica]|uniref:uncharacterized protein LOC117521179 n=1 Tax=Thalassophryne amazonica TaxID=390379 RepID=UPI0014713D02|nr:uncharacterized protein LOC117521179 [Thalassophryne amazonica]